MDWIKLWVTFRDDPKVLRLSDRAYREHVNTLLWCGHHETDGAVPDGLAQQKAVAELVASGLWEPVDDGFQIHNWEGRQRTAEQARAARIAGRKAAGMRWASGPQSESHSESDARPNTEVEEEVEVEEEQSKTTSTALRSKERDLAAGFDEFYAIFPRKRAPGDARKAWKQMRRKGHDADLIIAAAGRFRLDPNLPIDQTKIPYPATWLRAEQFLDGPLEAATTDRPRRHDAAAETAAEALAMRAAKGGDNGHGGPRSLAADSESAGALPDA